MEETWSFSLLAGTILAVPPGPSDSSKHVNTAYYKKQESVVTTHNVAFPERRGPSMTGSAVSRWRQSLDRVLEQFLADFLRFGGRPGMRMCSLTCHYLPTFLTINSSARQTNHGASASRGGGHRWRRRGRRPSHEVSKHCDGPRKMMRVREAEDG
jgi:hypothetical protein